MMYIICAPISLANYHVKSTIGRQPTVIREVSESILQDCLGVMGNIASSGIEDALFLLEWNNNYKPPKELIQSFGNITYLIVDKLEPWNELIKAKPWIEKISIKPDIYRNVLESLRAIFTQDAYDYFWSELCLGKFKCSPYKWNMELMALLIRQSSNKQRFTVEDLQSIYDMITPNLFESYVVNIGTIKGSQILHQMSMSELWALFIGNKTRQPYLYRYYVLQSRNTFVYLGVVQLQLAFNAGVIDLRSASIVFNEWIPTLRPTNGTDSIDTDKSKLRKLKQKLWLI